MASGRGENHAPTTNASTSNSRSNATSSLRAIVLNVALATTPSSRSLPRSCDHCQGPIQASLGQGQLQVEL